MVRNFRPTEGPHIDSTVLSELARLWDQAVNHASCDDSSSQNISQKQLADQSGVPTQTISSWSTGASLPRDMDRLVAVGRVLARWAGESAPTVRDWERRLTIDRAVSAETSTKPPRATAEGAMVTNEISGAVSGNVIQTGQVHGDITFN
ncbi:hypothetical protein NBRGN_004_00880 [Nocardia brasiliensis NBRC 14402]|nr:hypothetical protein NBRGN_004_00880 [Nocardia brasiliensis NBRC 14402]